MNPQELLDRYLKLPQAQRFLVVGGVLGFILLLFIYFSYLPSRTQLNALKGQLNTLTAQMMEKKRIAAELDRFKQEVENLKKELAEAQKVLPEKADIPNLLLELSSRGSEAGITIDSFQPKGEKALGFYSELNFELKIEGGYHDIATYLDIISKLKRIVKVTDLNIKPASKGQSKGKKKEQKGTLLVSSMKLVTYRFNPESSKKPGKKPGGASRVRSRR